MKKIKLIMILAVLIIAFSSCKSKDKDNADDNINADGDISSTSAPTPAITKPLASTGDDEVKIPKPNWRLAPMKYETKDTVVMGYDIRDFGVEPNCNEDVTNKIQLAMILINQAGGGTVFLPEGEYIVEGTLNIPKGVTLCGDWLSPDESPKIKGTILLAYSGKGRLAGTPFITLQPNSCIRDLSIWYPEQDAENIESYPATIRLYDPMVWGADYTHVKNITFVNSYVAVQQGPNGSGCPNVRNVYGTPLSIGISMDGIADIGRVDYVNFSADYWENSGLPGAPLKDSSLRQYLYDNACGITMGRVDWSYFTYTNITGYAVGIELREGDLSEAGNFPNGQVYRHTYNNCKVGIKVLGTSSVGEAFSEININGCETGILVEDNEKANETYIQFFNIRIDASKYAVYHKGGTEMSMTQADIINGQIYSEKGTIMVTGSRIESAAPQIALVGKADGIILSDVIFTNERIIDNQAKCRVIEETEDIVNIEVNEVPDCFEIECKPERNELYIAELDNTDNEDLTNALQALLDKAKEEGGGIVFIPPGEYNMKGSVVVPSGVELKGAVDLGRNPIRIGTILRIRTDSKDGDFVAAVTLEEKSGIRGIVFDYPEQDFTNPRPYPYSVRGNGKEVYIVNVSLRGAYNGVDLMTNKCDEHYVEYLSGICLNNVLKIGGGSENGKLYNMQVNYICITAGDESKFGTWDNSPTGDNKDSDSKLLEKYLQENLEVIILGDVTNQLLYDNFSYNGNVGIKFISENGNAASGWCVGHGVDYSSRGFDIEKLGNMQFINTQIVSFKKDTTNDNDICHIVLRDSVDSLVEFANVSVWARPVNNIRVENGTLRLYNGRIFNVPSTSINVSQTGKAELVNLSYKNDNDLVLADENRENIKVSGLLFDKNLLTDSGFNSLTGVYKKGLRFAVPDEILFGTKGIFRFADDFSDYPASDQNGIEKALNPSGNFYEFQAPTAQSYVSLYTENGNSYAKMFCDDTAIQSYIKSNAFSLEAGMMPNTADENIYTLEMKLKIDSLSSGSESKLFGSIKGFFAGKEAGNEMLFEFHKDGNLYVKGENICSYSKNEWYYLIIEFNLIDEENKSYQVSLYDSAGTKLYTAKETAIRTEFQKQGIVLRDFQLGVIGGMAAGSGQCEVLIDYIVVY